MIKLKKITPLFTQVLLTMDTYKTNQYVDGLIDDTKSEGEVKEIQKVIAVGSAVSKEIVPGKYVCFNPTRYGRTKHKEGSLKDGIITDNPIVEYRFPVIQIDDTPYLLVDNRDIDFVVEDFEEEPDTQENILVN